ncbi:MAG: hypothetical protein R2695_01050 [Acidimicrobiales bacterium]
MLLGDEPHVLRPAAPVEAVPGRRVEADLALTRFSEKLADADLDLRLGSGPRPST